MNNNVKIFISVIVLLVLGTVASVIMGGNSGTDNTPGKYDALAQCIKDSGAQFYGAFWCPHCQEQKKLFGSAAKLLPYIECSTLNGQGQLQICKDKKIEGYPTWELKDGTRLANENGAGVSLQTLAEKTGCTLPVEEKK